MPPGSPSTSTNPQLSFFQPTTSNAQIMASPPLIIELGLEREWAEATYNSTFIQALALGTLAPQNFDRWLVQDYLYVRAFTTFTAAVGCCTPPGHIDYRGLIHNYGYGALLTEREVFETNAANRGVSVPLTSKPSIDPVEENEAKISIAQELKPHFHPSCYEYADWMMSLVSRPGDNKVGFETLILLLWGIERCYYQAFLSVKESENFVSLDDSVKHFVEWWTASEFKYYIDKLERVFNDVQGVDTPWDANVARSILKTMLLHESKFWNSSFGIRE